MRQKRILAVVSGVALGGALGPVAYAANPEPVVVEVEFVAPITITENNPLQYGLIDVNIGTDAITIAPSGAVTDTGGRVLGGTQAAAQLTVTATDGEAINILVDGIQNGTGYTLGTFQCDYDGAGAAGCEGAGLNTTAAAGGTASLNIGATLTGNGAAAVGVDNGSFDVTIAYQ